MWVSVDPATNQEVGSSNLSGRAALATNLNRWPRKVTLDGHVPSHRALRLLRREIKRRCASMAGFKSFGNAAITIAGIELAHRIHKRQFSFGVGPTASRAVVEDAMGSGARLSSAIAETRLRSFRLTAPALEPF